MVRSQSEKDRAADKRLQKKYGITLAERNERARQQDNKCKICGGPLDPPCTDHFHFKIETDRTIVGGLGPFGYKWVGKGFDERGVILTMQFAKTQKAARAEVKKVLMPWSIRGLLCRQCNRALGMLERFFDAARHPENVQPALDYLSARLKSLDSSPKYDNISTGGNTNDRTKKHRKPARF